jgi:formamidopyrimidine-DNA glycosylase
MVEKDSFICKLAKEPWKMSGDELYGKLQRHKNSVIKSIILDQTIICGLGNIYADEALHYAKINPSRRAGTISLEEASRLVEGARVVMDRSLAAGGSTIRNYVKSDGTKGDYLELFAEVFNRQGKECRECGTKIVKIKVGGRGTHFCPMCQKDVKMK